MIEPGDTIWDIVVDMKYRNTTVLMPAGCYLRADGRFDIIEDYYDPEEDLSNEE
jgi:hypothetical protein